MHRPLLPTLLLCAQAPLFAATEVDGGLTVTGWVAEGGRADPVGVGSLDLALAQSAGPGELLLLIEGNTAVLPGSVPETFAGVDAGAGAAQLNGSNGTVQLSELKYRWAVPEGGALTVGLLDAAAYMDLAATANDEKTQFMNAALVNDPAIPFPDYTLGLAWEQGGAEETRFFGLLTGSHGLGDNPRQSYGQLFDQGRDGRRLFAAGGVRRAFGLLSAEAGAWANTADHPRLDGREGNRRNYGAYGVLGGAWETGGVDLRAGFANPEVTPGTVFVSATIGLELAPATMGVGWATTRLAPDAGGPGLDEARVTEWYLRVPVAGIEATLDLQYLENPGFDATVPASRIAGVRLRYAL